MRRSTPETFAAFRGMIKSKPSLEVSVTYSEGLPLLIAADEGRLIVIL